MFRLLSFIIFIFLSHPAALFAYKEKASIILQRYILVSNQGQGLGNAGPGNQGYGPNPGSGNAGGQHGSPAGAGEGSIPPNTSGGVGSSRPLPNVPSSGVDIPSSGNVPPVYIDEVSRLIEGGYVTTSEEKIEKNKKDTDKTTKTHTSTNLDKVINTDKVKEANGIEKNGNEVILKDKGDKKNKVKEEIPQSDTPVSEISNPPDTTKNNLNDNANNNGAAGNNGNSGNNNSNNSGPVIVPPVLPIDVTEDNSQNIDHTPPNVEPNEINSEVITEVPILPTPNTTIPSPITFINTYIGENTLLNTINIIPNQNNLLILTDQRSTLVPSLNEFIVTSKQPTILVDLQSKAAKCFTKDKISKILEPIDLINSKSFYCRFNITKVVKDKR